MENKTKKEHHQQQQQKTLHGLSKLPRIRIHHTLFRAQKNKNVRDYFIWLCIFKFEKVHAYARHNFTVGIWSSVRAWLLLSCRFENQLNICMSFHCVFRQSLMAIN